MPTPPTVNGTDPTHDVTSTRKAVRHPRFRRINSLMCIANGHKGPRLRDFRFCGLSGGFHYCSPVAGIRSAKVMAKAFHASFHLTAWG